MRVLEATLLLGDLLAFLLLALPRFRATRLPLYASLFTVLVLAAHVLIEGSRWQMVPAYVLTALFTLASLVLRKRPTPLIANMIARRLATGVVVVLAVIALAVAASLPVIVPSFRLADPTGPYPIGTVTYHWVDQGRADWGDPTARRELMVQVWYPAERTAGAMHDTYVQKGTDFSPLLRGKGLPGFFFDHVKNVHTHALLSAPMAANGGRFPVVIFSPGAQGFRQHSMFQVEELVSQGYVVAGIDHPGAATDVVFPDGRHVGFNPRLLDIPRFFKDATFADGIFNYLGRDASFVVDQMVALDRADPNRILTGRLDTDHMGILGMSLGGLVAAEACRTDLRLRACYMQDVFVPHDVMAQGLQQPSMWFTRDADSMRAEGWPEWEVDVHQSSMRTAFEGVRTDAYLVKLPGMFHVNYTDFPYLIASPVAQKVGLTGAIDWRRGHRVTNAYTVAFFDHVLKGKPEPLLDGPSRQFREVEFEARHHRK
jgi:predicted dienelactone hydrolase